VKLGVFTVLYRDVPFEEMLDKVKSLGLDAVELGTGNYPGDHHCNPEELLADPAKASAFRRPVESRPDHQRAEPAREPGAPHANDTYVDRRNVAVNGNLDTKHYGQVLDRAWTFRTVGYGQGERTWRDFVSALRAVDYDYVLSIEHEDQLMSMDQGLRKAIDLLHVVVREEKPKMWWA
jgi:sugar phosphate isomerase/epimerase